MQTILYIVTILAVYSVLASIIFEIFASVFNFRGRLLYNSVMKFSERDRTFVKGIYKSKGIKDARTFNFFKKPAFISPEVFARECLNFFKNAENKENSLEKTFLSIGLESGFSAQLQELYEESGKSPEKFRALLSDFFDRQIIPVKFQYKAISRIGLFVIGFALAIILNLDIFLLAGNIDTITSSQGSMNFSGWNLNHSSVLINSGFTMVLGWTITAVCVSFGAPYWFELMQKFTRVKV